MTLRVRIGERRGATVVTLEGAVDRAETMRTGAVLRRLVRRPRPVILDLNGLTLLDAGEVHGLVSALREADDGNDRLALVCGRHSGLKLLHRWRVAELAPLFTTVEAAIERGFKAAPPPASG